MLNLQEAVQAAKSYLPQMDPDDPYRDLLVEEVELNEGGDWEITLGFYRKRDITIFGGSFGGPPR